MSEKFTTFLQMIIWKIKWKDTCQYHGIETQDKFKFSETTLMQHHKYPDADKHTYTYTCAATKMCTNRIASYPLSMVKYLKEETEWVTQLSKNFRNIYICGIVFKMFLISLAMEGATIVLLVIINQFFS